MILQIALAVGALLLLIGAFLPWISSDFGGSANGFSGGNPIGWEHLVLALAVGGLVGARFGIRLKVLGLLAAGLGAVGGLMVTLASVIMLANDLTGIGVVFSLIAGLILLGAGIAAFVLRD